MIEVSLTENQSNIRKQRVRDINPSPTEKPDTSPSLTTAEIILPKVSITMTNSRGAEGPLVLSHESY